MSTFEDYDAVSTVYDVGRRPDGADVEAAMIQYYVDKPLKDIHVLDAGCGTGNFAEVFLQRGIGTVTLLDASDGMLQHAKAKLSKEIEDGRVASVKLACLPEIPFGDSTFDAVVFNHVLHHLPSNPNGTTFSEIDQSIAAARRVVIPGGIVAIMTCLPQILKDGFWYSNINSNIMERYIKRFPTLPMFNVMLEKHGLETLNVMNVFLNGMKSLYYNAEGPLYKEWRDMISFWKDGTDQEIKDVEEKVRKMKDAGTLEEYMNVNDRLDETGGFTLILARAV